MTLTADNDPSDRTSSELDRDRGGRTAYKASWTRRGGECLLAAATVAAATLMSSVAVAQVPQVQVALVFVLPVLISAALWGLAPSLVAVFLGVAAFDFFLTSPRFSFSMDQTADVVTLLLLLSVAGVASWGAAKARRSALRAQRADRRAHLLHELARGALRGSDESALLQLARRVLEDSFGVPAIILKARDGSVTAYGAREHPLLSSDDQDAARWAINHGKPIRAANYPYFGSRFDIWPVPGRRLAFGLQFGLSDKGRPDRPDELIDLVSGYVVGAAPRMHRSARPVIVRDR